MAPTGIMPHLSELRASWREADKEQPMLKMLIPIVVLAWLLERTVIPLSNWVPLVGAVWLTLVFSKARTRAAIDRLNRRWERFHLNNAVATAPESTVWLNKLLQTVWPNYLEPKLVQEYLQIVQKQLKEKRPKSIQSIEVEEFSLGTAPPQMGSTKTYWSNDAKGMVSLFMDFLFDTTNLSVVLGAKLAGPLRGSAVRLTVSHMFVKGQLKFIPILDGQALLYSFADKPEVHVEVAIAGGSSSISLSDLPGVATWLERLLLDALLKTMLEPRRRIRTLPLRNLHKHAVGGMLQVTVVSGEGLQPTVVTSPSGTWLSKRKSDAESQAAGPLPSPYVELSVGGLVRKTKVEKGTRDPLWDETMELPLHGSMATLYARVYDARERNVRQNPMGETELKIKYVADDSTIYWAVGRDEGVIAHRAESCGTGVVLTLPLLDSPTGEVTLRLTMKEWQFADATTACSPTVGPSFGRIDSVQLLTGRTVRVGVAGARDLKAADYSGFSDPYIKLQYGNITRRTKTVAQNLNPIWNETFEFKELSGGEHLRLRVFDSDKYNMDKNIGVARVNLQTLVEGEKREVWVPLEKAETGEVRLQLEVLGKDYDLARQAHAIATRNVQPAAVTQRDGPATLDVTLVEARDLKAADWNGTSDPYVSVKYGAMKQRSKVIYKTLAPQWNQTLEFADSGEKHLALHVKDYNTVMSSTSIGHCQISLEGLEDNATRDVWATLTGVKKGEIHLQIMRRVATKVVPAKPVEPPLEKLTPEVIAASKLQLETNKFRTLLQRAIEMSSDEELKSVLGELEQAEQERGGIVSQLEKDRNTLVSKIKELELVMQVHGGFANVMRAQADRDVLVAKVKQLEDAMSGL